MSTPNQGFKSVVPVYLRFSRKKMDLPNHGSSDGENGDGHGDNNEALTVTRT